MPKLNQLQRVVDKTLSEEKLSKAFIEEAKRVYRNASGTTPRRVAESVNFELDVAELSCRDAAQLKTSLMIECLKHSDPEVRRVAVRMVPAKFVKSLTIDKADIVRHAACDRSNISVIKEALQMFPSDDQMRTTLLTKLADENGVDEEQPGPISMYADKRMGDSFKEADYPYPELSDVWYETQAFKMYQDYAGNIEGMWENAAVNCYCNAMKATSLVEIDRDKLLKALQKVVTDKEERTLERLELNEGSMRFLKELEDPRDTHPMLRVGDVDPYKDIDDEDDLNCPECGSDQTMDADDEFECLECGCTFGCPGQPGNDGLDETDDSAARRRKIANKSPQADPRPHCEECGKVLIHNDIMSYQSECPGFDCGNPRTCEDCAESPVKEGFHIPSNSTHVRMTKDEYENTKDFKGMCATCGAKQNYGPDQNNPFCEKCARPEVRDYKTLVDFGNIELTEGVELDDDEACPECGFTPNYCTCPENTRRGEVDREVNRLKKNKDHKNLYPHVNPEAGPVFDWDLGESDELDEVDELDESLGHDACPACEHCPGECEEVGCNCSYEGCQGHMYADDIDKHEYGVSRLNSKSKSGFDASREPTWEDFE